MAEEKKQEFWRWTETNWVNPDVDWKKAKYITVGIDVGSVSSQAVVMADGEVYVYGNMRTGSDSPNSARNALKFALEATDMTEERVDYWPGVPADSGEEGDDPSKKAPEGGGEGGGGGDKGGA